MLDNSPIDYDAFVASKLAHSLPTGLTEIPPCPMA